MSLAGYSGKFMHLDVFGKCRMQRGWAIAHFRHGVMTQKRGRSMQGLGCTGCARMVKRLRAGTRKGERQRCAHTPPGLAWRVSRRGSEVATWILGCGHVRGRNIKFGVATWSRLGPIGPWP